MALSVEVFATFFLISLVSVLVARKLKTPYTMLLVIVGLVLAAVPIALLANLYTFFNRLAEEQLFVGLIIPPLLFESVIEVKLSDFRAVYRPALLMATAGVAMSTLVVGVVLWKVVGLPILVAFLFAALISPTDVATVLEVFGRVNVPQRLATLVEMEAVFNDPTGIAIFTIVLTSAAASTLRPFLAVATFSYELSAGVLIGLGVAWGARRLQAVIEDSTTQVVLTLVAVYGAYALAQGLMASGLIAVAVTGLMYGNTVLFRVESKQVADVIRQFWVVVAFVANAAAFIFIGLSTNIFLLFGGLDAILVAYGVVVMARITSVYPILSLTKAGGSSIPSAWMNVSTLGGMRGALAIVLVSAITDLATRQLVATLTFGVVMLSIFFQGPLLISYTRSIFGHQETIQHFVEEKKAADIEENKIEDIEQGEKTGPEEPAPPETPSAPPSEPQPAEAPPGPPPETQPAEPLSPEPEGRGNE